MRDRNGENQPNSRLLNDMTKYLRIINIFLLNKAFTNQSSLIILNVVIDTTLYLVCLMTVDNIHLIIKRIKNQILLERSA
jgi:hypothetical protein